MKILSTNLPLSSISIYQLKEKSSDEFHDHGPFYQISIPLLGNPYMEFHGQTKLLEHRAVTVVGEEHRNFTNEGPIRLMLLSLHHELIEKVFTDKTGKLPSNQIEFQKWGLSSSEQLKKLGKKVIKTVTEGWDEETYLEQLEWEIACLLLNIQDGSHTAHWQKEVSTYGNPALQQILQFITMNYGEKLSIPTIAEQFNISQMQLYRLFQEHLALTPNEYLREIRLQSATQLLQEGKKDITEICFNVGFGSLSSFERSFKKKFGVTPKEFRENLR